MTVLAGCNCLITGASRGLGRQIVQTFWEAGANVILVSRSEKALAEVSAALPTRLHQRSMMLEADLSDPFAAGQIVERAKSRFTTLDVLVNNAGVQGPIGTLWANDWPEWECTLRVNLLSPIALCRNSIPWMALGRRGKIINLSGGGAASARPHFTAYATAKAGLVRFTESLAEETKQLGIDVNCVAPGAMDTAMLREVVTSGSTVAGRPEYERAIQAQQAGKRTLLRAAELCLFLASPVSDGITGKLISAVWDRWADLPGHLDELQQTDIYTLRRIVPEDRGKNWGQA